LICWIVVILSLTFADEFGKNRHMGGIGSGNWYRRGKKDTVEDCRSLDVRRW
jgi:hypothetical protein